MHHPTPSTTASPVPRRPPFFSLPPARADGPSPSKRRKLPTPTPESPASSSLSTPAPHPQLHAERRASSLRVLDVWAGLEDKYARPLGKDDILDLRTGALVRDRGVLSGTAKAWNIGYFADAADGGDAEDESVGREEDESSEDEMAAWGEELDSSFKPAHVPPVQEQDPKDAEELREFLAAEQARRAEHGDDDDDDSLGDPLEVPDDTNGVDERNVDADDVYTEGSVVDVEAGSALAQSDEDSPDELEGYDNTVGEGAILTKISSDMAESFPEPLRQEYEHKPRTKTPAPFLPPPGRFQTPAQLRTPPQSRGSVKPPPIPAHRPLPILPKPEPPKVMFPQKGKQSETHPPRAPHADTRSPTKGKSKADDIAGPSITPTKNLVPEVLISPRRRASTVLAQKADKIQKTPSKPRARVLSASHIPDKLPVTDRPVTHRPSTPPLSKPARSSPEPRAIPVDVRRPVSMSPRRPAKRKRVSSQGAATTPENHPGPAPRAEHRNASSSSRPSQPPSAPAPDFWPPYARHASMAPPYTPMAPPYTPSHAREPTPLLDAQLIAQAMQNLAYFAYASPSGAHPGWGHPHYPPPPAHHAPPYHAQHAPAHPPPPAHSSPYPFQHPHAQPPWPFPPYPHPYTSPAHTHPPPPSSPLSFSSGPPSSPTSSPLSGRGRGKRVSFPDETPQSDDNEEEEKGVSERQKSLTKKPKARRGFLRPMADARSADPAHDDPFVSSGSGSRPAPGPARSKSKSRR